MASREAIRNIRRRRLSDKADKAGYGGLRAGLTGKVIALWTIAELAPRRPGSSK
jgi:hypothetical protein